MNKFLFAALRAGGRRKAKPDLSRGELRRYSATFLDLDNNLIKVMYREPPRGDLDGSDMQRINKWQEEVAYNVEGKANIDRNSNLPKTTVNNITASPAIEVYRIRPETRGDGEISTKAIIGTILGASAGAAVAYAMARGESEKERKPESRRKEYHAVEAPPQRKIETRVIYEAPHHFCGGARDSPITVYDLEESRSKHSSAGSRIKTVVSSHPRSAFAGAHRSVDGSHTGRTIVQTNGTKIMSGEPQAGTASGNSRPPTSHGVEIIKGHPKPNGTEIRSARNVPLPPSRVSTLQRCPTDRDSLADDLTTVVPDDSISQVSTKRSSKQSTSEHLHHRKKSGHNSKHGRHSSQGSKESIKAADRYSSTRNSYRR